MAHFPYNPYIRTSQKQSACIACRRGCDKHCSGDMPRKCASLDSQYTPQVCSQSSKLRSLQENHVHSVFERHHRFFGWLGLIFSERGILQIRFQMLIRYNTGSMGFCDINLRLRRYNSYMEPRIHRHRDTASLLVLPRHDCSVRITHPVRT